MFTSEKEGLEIEVVNDLADILEFRETYHILINIAQAILVKF